MYFTKILLSIVFVLFASTALAAKPDKTLVCHVGNEYGPESQIYDPTCEPDEFYDCSADAGKVDLITMSKKAKHIGNPAHSFEDDTGYLWEDYSPEDGVGDEAADFEEGDVVGIDRGCELLEELEKIVFVTSGTYTGDLVGAAGALGLGTFNGLEAGDAICNYHATNTTGGDALPGTYTAWLSDSSTNAINRVTNATVPYVLPNGTQVAANFDQIIPVGVSGGDFVLDNAIRGDETGALIPVLEDLNVWTGTGFTGTYSGVSCNNWGSDTGTGGMGRTSEQAGTLYGLTTRWTQGSNNGNCSNLKRIYCFQD